MSSILTLWLALAPAALAQERSAYPIETALPVFPESLIGGPNDLQLCETTLTVQPDGSVSDVIADDCAGILYDPVREAMKQWRYNPIPGEGRAAVTVGVFDPGKKGVVPADAEHVVKPWKEVRVKAAVAPAFTTAIPPKEWGERTVTCAVEVAIAPTGRAAFVAVSNCDTFFRREVANAMLRWKWHKTGLETYLRTGKKITYTYHIAR